MGIFVPGKNGDAMGDYAYQRMTKKGKAIYRANKDYEQEREDASEHRARERQKVREKMEQIRREARKRLGLSV